MPSRMSSSAGKKHSSERWYVFDDDEKRWGPYSSTQMIRFLREGKIGPHWEAVGETTERRAPAENVAAEIKRENSKSNLIIAAVIVGIFVVIYGFSALQNAARENVDTMARDAAQAIATPDRASEDVGQKAHQASRDIPTAKRWVKVKEWRGKGMKTTESFTVGGEWAVEWNTQPGQFEGNFIVQANHPGEQIGKLAANVMGSSHNTSYIYEAGTFCLDINSTQPWHVIVWDKR